jgi:hypothetical protein
MRGIGSALRAVSVLLLAAWIGFAWAEMQARPAGAAGILPNGQAGSMAHDPGLHRLFIAQPSTNKVYVVNDATMLLLGVLRVPARPAALALDQDRHLLYVASDEAGLVTTFNARSLKQVRREAVGGRPGGLTLLDTGHTLLIADQASGTVSRLPIQPRPGPLVRALAMGPGLHPTTMLSSHTAPYGGKVMVWGQNFGPGEAVQVFWGMVPVASLHADALGAVTGTFVVPRHSDLGLHLVILMGRASDHAQSGLLNVVKPPPPPVRAVKALPKPKSVMTQRMDKLFASRVSLQPPKLLAIGPLSHHTLSVPTMYLVLVYIVLTMVLLILRRSRSRRSGGKHGGKGAVPTPMPKAVPARIAS